MNRERVLEKIRKCLALSNSANEHEAAAAMRQAHRLMELHGLQSSDPAMFEVTDREVKTKHQSHPRWMKNLAAVVSRAFGCSLMRGRGRFVFVGTGAGPEVAQYTFEVLNRLQEAQKQAHTNNPFRREKLTRSMKIRMGKAFREGWVYGVSKKVNEFAQELTDEQDRTHTDYMLAKTQQARIKEGKPGKSAVDHHTVNAAKAGYQRGQQVDLKHGVGATQQQRLNRGAA